MSFKFQWAPLIADTSRAREMLTTALNKSPKPPIIVDDIVVTELNLGSTPPELEILEVGDIAEDRFRGIFKMSYSGDAYLTLKTRVQANPLNTFLSAKPSFASPQPLAASSGLTIPLQITLSDIILSGFVVLVFSRQKGITLVFRNDPLESLKVSSTFDSIPFVRDYLQKEIEQQLRILFMEDLPAIIHRLSLKLWVPDHLAGQIEVNSNRLESSYSDKPQGANVTPSQRAKDRDTDDAEVSPFSLDGADSYVTFSQKNLLKLAALNDCNRTLALFTPSISDVVYRAWAGSHERADATGRNTPGMSLATLSRVHASNPSLNSLRSADTASTASGSARPPLTGHNPSTSSVFSASTKSRPHHGKKRRKRVVDLRKKSADGGEEHHTGSRPTTPPSSYAPSSSQSHTGSYEREGEVNTPHDSPEKSFSELHISDTPVVAPTPRAREPSTAAHMAFMDSLGSSPGPTEIGSSPAPHSPLNQDTIRQRRAASSSPSPVALRKSATFSSLASFAEEPPRRPSLPKLPSLPSQPSYPNTPGAILAQAWIARIQADVDRKWQEERRRAAESEPAGGAPSSSSLGKLREQGLWALENGEDASPPPPAYHV